MRSLASLRVAIGSDDDLQPVTTRLAAALQSAGVTRRVLYDGDWSVQAAEANDFTADVYLGLSLTPATVIEASYFEVPASRRRGAVTWPNWWSGNFRPARGGVSAPSRGCGSPHPPRDPRQLGRPGPARRPDDGGPEPRSDHRLAAAGTGCLGQRPRRRWFSAASETPASVRYPGVAAS